eukprot:maker-scaffold458_size165745-snap-gene-0.19 protein:Tk09030 transcript:maker-scaffold458_size165745-snap-gene-0.19-mRNA-1 annotation:"hypothetical protein BRAFLDRAFT_123347"
MNELIVRAIALEAWQTFHSSDGENGGRNPIGNIIFPSAPDGKESGRATTRSKVAGLIMPPLRQTANTFPVHASNMWNKFPELRMATIIGAASVEKDDSGTLIMIANDGTQHPPLQFPPGVHLMQFLSCLETSLYPHGTLEPPLSQAAGEKSTKDGQDSSTSKKSRRLLPLLKRRKQITESTDISEMVSPITKLTLEKSIATTSTSNDFVFKIVPLTPQSSLSSAPLLKPPGSAPADFMGSTGSLLSTGSLPKTKSDWFSSLFSPSKSRHDSASTDTSRSQSLSEYSGPDASTSTASSTHNSNDILEEVLDEELLVLTEGGEGGQISCHLSVSVTVHRHQPSPSEPITTLCNTMKKQIITRAFYGWLSHVRHLRTARQHLSGLAFHEPVQSFNPTWGSGVTTKWWNEQKESLLMGSASPEEESEGNSGRAARILALEEEIHLRIYYGGIEPCVRKQIWPYLLSHYKWNFNQSDVEALNRKTQSIYENKLSDWMAIEAIVRQRDKETAAANIAKLSGASVDNLSFSNSMNMSNEVFESIDDPLSSRTVSADKISTITECTENSENNSSEKSRGKLYSTQSEPSPRRRKCSDEGIDDERGLQNGREMSHSDDERPTTVASRGILVQNRTPNAPHRKKEVSYKVTTPSVDSGNPDTSPPNLPEDPESLNQHAEDLKHLTDKIASLGRNLFQELPEDTLSSASGCQSPVSSEGGMYPPELIDNFALNLHRIDKDVMRCDRNLAYFTDANLEKLRNVITTYVWENLDVGYMQGMCDLVAPLLVIFDDEPITHACFLKVMERMLSNFPTGTQMDENFANMRSLIQVLDQTLYDTIQQNGDFSHFYFCYRWFLLDFKREFTYHEIYLVWETIWASRKVASANFYLFVALALVENYRDIILDQNMDFTDIIKFFNEMAEKHHARDILQIARDQVHQLQAMISDT